VLRVNGDDFYANYDLYRAVLGYVPQDDILHATLTVEDALTYTATAPPRRHDRPPRSRPGSRACSRTSRWRAPQAADLGSLGR
jgi:hypothetical protein